MKLLQIEGQMYTFVGAYCARQRSQLRNTRSSRVSPAERKGELLRKKRAKDERGAFHVVFVSFSLFNVRVCVFIFLPPLGGEVFCII